MPTFFRELMIAVAASISCGRSERAEMLVLMAVLPQAFSCSLALAASPLLPVEA